MSSPSLTLQCRQCSGIFAAPKVDFSSLVQCPHCATAAPIMEFLALKESPSEEPEIGQSISPSPPLSSEPEPDTTPATPKKEGAFQVRGKWLQFDCPHCVRPMRLVIEDAGGLVDCAHCGLELIAPDPAIGRGAQLSRASEGRVDSLSRFNMNDMRGDQLKHSKSQESDSTESWSTAEESDDDFEEFEVGEAIDPNHALARAAANSPTERKRAVKALESGKLGRSFRRQDVVAEQASAASDSEWQPVTERTSFAEGRQDKYGFWIALGIASVVMLGIVGLVIKEASKPTNEVFDEGQIQAIDAAKTLKSQFRPSYEFAKAALASSDWESLAPHVRNSERVTPLMRRYYAEVPYKPVILSSFHAPVLVEVGGLSMQEIRATNTDGETWTLVIETTAGELKIDWELMVNLPKHHWAKFLEERPSDPRSLSIIASRSSVQDRYFKDAGLSRDEAIGIRLWHGTANDQFAILPKGSEIATKLSGLLKWDQGRKIIIEASFDPESELNDRIEINGVVQTGWVIE